MDDPLVRARLPLVTSEVGDTWIYGVPSDPQKVSRMRVINRAWEQLASQTEVRCLCVVCVCGVCFS